MSEEKEIIEVLQQECPLLFKAYGTGEILLGLKNDSPYQIMGCPEYLKEVGGHPPGEFCSLANGPCLYKQGWKDLK